MSNTDQKMKKAVEKEIVICAAMRHPHLDHIVIKGHRHSDCLFALWGMGYSKHQAVLFDQGFITSQNRFVDRVEALEIQKAAGIKSYSKDGYRHELNSEDLY